MLFNKYLKKNKFILHVIIILIILELLSGYLQFQYTNNKNKDFFELNIIKVYKKLIK